MAQDFNFDMGLVDILVESELTMRRRRDEARQPTFHQKFSLEVGGSEDLYSTEDVFDFSAEAPGRSLVESFFNIGELFEQPLLLAGQPSRRDDRSDHKQIATSVALQ